MAVTTMLAGRFCPPYMVDRFETRRFSEAQIEARSFSKSVAQHGLKSTAKTSRHKNWASFFVV
ncbi:hypothetical protein [Lapidilactobacillus mulanensis]|uniref:hypothetical protein n=1 Tax=Lapidilactobacillus mulanensis TaxID=2485999 RepID=UPI000F778F92|nr:hypothetical protein [Lapidilactobacillus mulanensis]